MWSQFSSIASLAAGLFGGLQNSFNTGEGGLNYTELNPFTPYAQFARAAYCDPSKVAGWRCGEACRAIPGFTEVVTGGDGDDIQFFYVGYWPTESAVVVAHQGTNPKEMLAVLTDVHFHFMTPDADLFPGIPSGARVHSGFMIEHIKTQTKILAEVKRLMKEFSSTNVVLVGHSLGGALAEIDTLFLTLNLPAATSIRGVTFGKPRVGNRAWSEFFDSKVSNFTRINNKHDPVPVVPGRGLLGHGFRHPATEIHIQADGRAVVCPGSDDGVDLQCSVMTVPDVFRNGKNADHNGPYNGVSIGTQNCIS